VFVCYMFCSFTKYIVGLGISFNLGFLPCTLVSQPITCTAVMSELFSFVHHHHISVMELGNFLTRSSLTYREVSSKVYHDSFCQLGSSVSLPRVIYFEALYLHVVCSFCCIPVVCPKFVLFLTPLQFMHLFLICPSVSCCSSHVFHLCCCYSSGVPSFNSPSFATV